MNLADTNVLLRCTDASDPTYPVVWRAISTLESNGDDFCFFPQNLYEFWVVATRPKKVNGLGLSTVECEARIATLKQLFMFLPDPPDLFDSWEQLVSRHLCHGKMAHDARLVAAMQLHGVGRILTFNVTDFTRFPGIAVIDPATVAP